MGEINLYPSIFLPHRSIKKLSIQLEKSISKLGRDRRRSNILGSLRENKYSVDWTWSHKNYSNTCTCVQSLQSCLTLCNPMDCSPQSSSVHGILQLRVLDRLPNPPPGDLPDEDQTCIFCVSCIGRQVLYHWYHLGSTIPTHLSIKIPVSFLNIPLKPLNMNICIL